jgi:hypothetical protein
VIKPEIVVPDGSDFFPGRIFEIFFLLGKKIIIESR